MVYAAGDNLTAAKLNDMIAAQVAMVADGVAGGPQSFTSGVTANVQWPVSQTVNAAIITISGTNNQTFTVVKAGFFLIETALRLAAGTTGLELSIKINGVRVSASQGTVLTSCTRARRLAVSDAITITAIHTTGSSKAVESGAEETSHLTIARLGE